MHYQIWWLYRVYYPRSGGVQTACLALFLVLFFVVCWPYGASPADVSSDWSPENIDLESQRVILTRDVPAEPWLASGGPSR